MGAPLSEVSQKIKQQGRNGDTVLAHISPDEARMLMQMGGAGTINPQTGLPEFYTFADLSPSAQKYLTKKWGNWSGGAEDTGIKGQADTLEDINKIIAYKGGNTISDIGQLDESLAPLIKKREKRGVGGALGTLINIGLPIAASFITGIGPVIGGAFGGALAGGITSGSLKGALKGGAIGGLSGLASGVGSRLMAGQSVGTAFGNTISTVPGLSSLAPSVAKGAASNAVGSALKSGAAGKIATTGSGGLSTLASAGSKVASSAGKSAAGTGILDKVMAGDVSGLAKGALGYALEHPLTTLSGVAGVAGMLQDSKLDRAGDDGSNEQLAAYRQQQAEEAARFAEALGKPVDPRQQNAYTGNLYTYGETPTSFEHRFFEPQQPVGYAEGGQVPARDRPPATGREVTQDNALAEIERMIAAGLIDREMMEETVRALMENTQLASKIRTDEPAPARAPARGGGMMRQAEAAPYETGGGWNSRIIDVLPGNGYAEGGMVSETAVQQLMQMMTDQDPNWLQDPAKVQEFNTAVEALKQREVESSGGLGMYVPNDDDYTGGPTVFAKGGYADGGTAAGGQDDTIPAKLSEGEYVIPADAVSALGDGNPKAGAQKIERMIKGVRRHKSGTGHPPKAREASAYMGGK